MSHLIVSGKKINGLDDIWFIGDDFADQSYVSSLKHVKSTDDNPIYVSDHYEIRGYTTNQYKSLIRSILARLTALLAKAIAENIYLPKAVVIVPDADIATDTVFPRECAFPAFEHMIKFMMKSIHRMIQITKKG